MTIESRRPRTTPNGWPFLAHSGEHEPVSMAAGGSVVNSNNVGGGARRVVHLPTRKERRQARVQRRATRMRTSKDCFMDILVLVGLLSAAFVLGVQFGLAL